MNDIIKLESPLPNPAINILTIIGVFFLIFFGKGLSIILLLPLIGYFVIVLKLRIGKFVTLSILIFILFFCINFFLNGNLKTSFITTLDQASRWCILLFVGFYFDYLFSVSSVVYLFNKARMFNLSIPFLVASKLIGKLKYDIDVGNKAAIVRGLQGFSLNHIWLRATSILFMLLSTSIIFLLEFGTLLKIRGVEFPQKNILDRFHLKISDYLIITYIFAVIAFDKFLIQ